jgi:hypothetical protein
MVNPGKMKTSIKNTAAGLLVLFSMSCGSSSTKEDISYSARNPDYCEYSPTISADGKTLIYQADMHKKGDYKIYIKQLLNGKWTLPRLLENVNSDYSDGGPFITYDQNFLIISSKRPGGFGNADLWVSQRIGDRWARPVNMGRPVNSSGYDGFASLSPDGRVLYFVRECPEKKECTSDKFGIFTSVNDEGGWSEPVKMPYPINTDYCEFGPIILADGNTLLFSSTRPGGFGSYDLYKTEKMEDGAWSKPVNLGSFINTKMEDSLVSITASGDIMYYTRAKYKDRDSSRIYSVPIPVNMRQSKVITLSGTVMDAKNEAIKIAAKITITDISRPDKPPIVIKSNEEDGKYIVILNKGKVCDISVSGKGYLFYSTKIDLKALTEFREVKKDIRLEPLQIGSAMVLHNLYFEYMRWRLLADSKYELNRVIKLMNENPGMKLEISGHTDNTGTLRYNRTLSQKRAWSVVNYLVAHGVPLNRLVARGYGPSKPIVSNNNARLRARNRRVELKVLTL